jgi:hypothetical protein
MKNCAEEGAALLLVENHIDDAADADNDDSDQKADLGYVE